MNTAESPVSVLDIQISAVLPDGSKFYIGRPSFRSRHAFVDATYGRFERWRFERNTRRFNALVTRHLEKLTKNH